MVTFSKSIVRNTNTLVFQNIHRFYEFLRITLYSAFLDVDNIRNNPSWKILLFLLLCFTKLIFCILVYSNHG